MRTAAVLLLLSALAAPALADGPREPTSENPLWFPWRPQSATPSTTRLASESIAFQ